jgi:predicted SAM-dependent methyltransferase
MPMKRTLIRVARQTVNSCRGALVGIGSGKVCPICGWEGRRFLKVGRLNARRFDARCPKCGSLERHRLAFKVSEKIGLEKPITLHVAPERSMQKWLRGISKDYLSIDLSNNAMVNMDLCKLELPDESYTLIYCSHVLEHISDDRAAMREMYRVCKKGGMAIVQIPVWGKETIEDPNVVTEEQRLDHYNQKDHVRAYGMDVVDRLTDVGFKVEIHRPDEFPQKEVFRHSMAFLSTNEVFICRKV